MMPRALATSPDTDMENFALQVKKKQKTLETQECMTNQLLSDKLEIRRGCLSPTIKKYISVFLSRTYNAITL